MSIKFSELRERAEAGELTEADVAYLKAREGLSVFDSLRAAADDAVFADDEDDDDDDDDDDPYADLSYADLKAELDAREIVYKGNASADDLVALLREDDEA